MIKKHPGLIGLPRPSFMSRTHICEYRDKLYEISRVTNITNIRENLKNYPQIYVKVFNIIRGLFTKRQQSRLERSFRIIKI